MRLPKTVHTSQPWRIHEIASDFRIEDVWALPVQGSSYDFPKLVDLMASLDPARSSSAVRALLSVRTKLGEIFGWDREETGIDSRVPTLRDRLPADLRAAETGPASAALPFRSVYLLEDEWAAEIANQTMHGVLHLGWVLDEHGGYRGQMAVLVKPNGTLGRVYMAAIKPFRYLIVYPRLLRRLDQAWREREAADAN